MKSCFSVSCFMQWVLMCFCLWIAWWSRPAWSCCTLSWYRAVIVPATKSASCSLLIASELLSVVLKCVSPVCGLFTVEMRSALCFASGTSNRCPSSSLNACPLTIALPTFRSPFVSTVPTFPHSSLCTIQSTGADCWVLRPWYSSRRSWSRSWVWLFRVLVCCIFLGEWIFLSGTGTFFLRFKFG